MKQSIVLANTKIDYIVRHSNRARRMRLVVDCADGLVVTIPARLSMARAEQFISQKATWILRSLQFWREQSIALSLTDAGLTIPQAKIKARDFVEARLKYWNQFYKFSYRQIFIKSSKRKWGSCSYQKNLNFNYQIILLPQVLADYIVVHELCHLRELNHSPKFWKLVAQTFPNYRTCRQELRKYVFSRPIIG